MKRILKNLEINTVNTVDNNLNHIIKKGKNKLDKMNLEVVVYEIDCKNCDMSYIIETGRRLTTRISEQKGNIDRIPEYYDVISKHIFVKKRLHDFDW